MAKLTTKRRDDLPKSKFALPGGTKGSDGEPAYPIDTAARAQNAKARAKQQLKKGNLTKSQFDTVVRKANVKLKKSGAKDIQSASQMLKGKKSSRKPSKITKKK